MIAMSLAHWIGWGFVAFIWLILGLAVLVCWEEAHGRKL